jgi:septum formation protein
MHQLAQKLQKYHVILGSASPRRKELLQGLDIPFDVILKNTQEIIDATLPFEQIPLDIAQQKFKAFLPDLSAQDFLITADTLVFCEGKSVGKPKNKIEAKEMISFLSGKAHSVVTGVCFGTRQKQEAFYQLSQVTFATMNEADIDYYIAKYKPLDKAGAYGVQEWIGYMGIESICGSYYNVMGLPVHSLYYRILDYEE